MRTRTLLTTLAVAALGCTVLAPASATAWPFQRGDRTVPLELDGGSVEVQLVPDRGRALPLTRQGANRWAFEGSTTALVGGSYSIHLKNRTPERLKIVVGVDGVNVYHRDPIVGRADGDIGSILSPWSERLLRGWQLDSDTAQRFVFSPPEWSEGQGKAEHQIGTIVIQVYRERQWRRRPQRDSVSEGAPELEQRSEAERMNAPSAPIGTTSGDDVSSPVRTVHFVARTTYPEAWAEIDYGRGQPPRPPHRPRHYELLGLDLESASGGARIVAVEPGSEADRAGLEPWDVIVRVDTEDRPRPATVRRILRAKDRGDFVFLRVRRGPHELAVKIRT